MRKFLLVIIILAIAGLIGYQFWKGGSVSYTPPKMDDLTSRSAIPADWKEYNSATFTFRHPPNWVPVEAEPGLLVLKTSPSQSLENAPISINAMTEFPYLRAVEEIRRDMVEYEEREVTIANMRGIEITGILSAAVGGEERFSIFTMLDRAGKLVSLDYTEFKGVPSETREDYRWVVSTFAEDGVE